MAALGTKTEIMNAQELTLEVGSDNYVMLTNLKIHGGKSEDRLPTTDAGALYTYGKGDNWFTATLALTHPEAITLSALNTIDSNGDMPSTTWLIKGKALDATTVTYTCEGVLRDYDLDKPSEGTVTIDIFVRITSETIPIA